MVRTGAADPAIQHFTKYHTGLFNVMLVEQNPSENAESMQTQRMFEAQGGSEMFQRSIQ